MSTARDGPWPSKWWLPVEELIVGQMEGVVRGVLAGLTLGESGPLSSTSLRWENGQN